LTGFTGCRGAVLDRRGRRISDGMERKNSDRMYRMYRINRIVRIRMAEPMVWSIVE